jgi:hypothetical protein
LTHVHNDLSGRVLNQEDKHTHEEHTSEDPVEVIVNPLEVVSPTPVIDHADSLCLIFEALVLNDFHVNVEGEHDQPCD